MSPEKESAVLRIGELSRRVGISEHVLRAWESRYGLLKPARSSGGYRLYSEHDQSRVRLMQAHLADGLAAAQAAHAALAGDEPTGTAKGSAPGISLGFVDQAPPAGEAPKADLQDLSGVLAQTLDDLDEPGAQAVLDRLLMDFTVETVLRDVLLPYLKELGVRWERGKVSVAQEHFASYLVRGRLEGMARGWGNGRGPQALLACPPDELHDLALLVFGIVLNRNGWRIAYLGASTPMPDTIAVTSDLRPSLVVLAATTTDRFAALVPELSTLADLAPLVLAGAGATGELARSIGARVLSGDPVTAAEHLAGSLS